MEGKRDQTRRRMLEALPKGGKGAEIGVWEGKFSSVILEVAEPVELHLIDPWVYDPRFNNTGFGRKKNADRMPQMYDLVAEKFAGDDRIVMHRATSAEALLTFDDNSLDWVYIDGNHNDPFITIDLQLSQQKVRAGGVIAGDDFHWNDGERKPVKEAVHKFVEGLGDQATLEVIGQQYIIRMP